MKTSVIYITAVLTLLGLTVSRQAKTFNLSENKNFQIAQSGQVYRCIQQRNQTYIVPGITGAYIRYGACFIPVKLGRCMEKTVFDKAFVPCGTDPGDRRYYLVRPLGSGTPFIIY
jgi:nitrate/nitrite transporter NarK